MQKDSNPGVFFEIGWGDVMRRSASVRCVFPNAKSPQDRAGGTCCSCCCCPSFLNVSLPSTETRGGERQGIMGFGLLKPVTIISLDRKS